ncbi:hypothetical protein RvY_14845 [Ramazzottius varieornatus]|uniref:Uncharacterized protein n=1 Tax=Ramazzottius varieornatus TaxID=947166 RepID=A0A1D1VU86_RAMVA|nr:hypothetical protein RvY_14845 [Ramazzottius varieornatus]
MSSTPSWSPYCVTCRCNPMITVTVAGLLVPRVQHLNLSAACPSSSLYTPLAASVLLRSDPRYSIPPSQPSSVLSIDLSPIHCPCPPFFSCVNLLPLLSPTARSIRSFFP